MSTKKHYSWKKFTLPFHLLLCTTLVLNASFFFIHHDSCPSFAHAFEILSVLSGDMATWFIIWDRHWTNFCTMCANSLEIAVFSVFTLSQDSINLHVNHLPPQDAGSLMSYNFVKTEASDTVMHNSAIR